MPYNGSGSYQLPAGNPVVTGSTISSTTHNNTMSDIASALTNAMTKDGQSTPTANLKMGGFKHTGLGAGSAATDSANLAQVQGNAYCWLGTGGGTADVITASASPTLTAYAAGQVFRFLSSGANTTNVTLNIDGLGAKAVTKNGTTALAAGDIPAGALCEVVYDGTQFQLLGVVADRLKRAGDTLTGALNAAATATVASATTCDIGAATSNSVIISGTTTITGLGTIAAGAVRDVAFSGALTLTHNATSLILPAGASITTAAGDTASFVSLGSGNWRCLSYQKADGTPLKLGTNSLGNSGYQKLPGGLILQWGRGTTASGTASVTFPVAFPSACFAVVPGWNMGSNQSASAIEASTPTTTGFSVFSSPTYAFDFFWIALGN
jgi:hypothetical protein